MKKKILFVSTNDWIPWGGSEELWSLTAISMAHTHEIHVSVKGWDPEPRHISRLRDSGAIIFKRWDLSHTLSEKLSAKFRKLVNKPKSDFDVLDNHDYDLIVISQGTNSDGLAWMEASVQRKCKFVAIVHLAAESHWPSDTLGERLRTVYKSVDRIFFVSNKNKLLTEKQLGIDLPQAKIAKNPFKVEYESQFYFPDITGTINIASVAAYSIYHKGQDVLFEVIKEKKWKERPIQFLLYGKGNNHQNLQKLIERWDLKNVKLENFSDDIQTIWSKNHALVMPSRIEGLPLALVEAMLCGRVSVVTDVGGNNEIVENNVNGFIAKAPTAELFDEAMERAWNRLNEWPSIGRNAYTSIREKVPIDPINSFQMELLQCVQ